MHTYNLCLNTCGQYTVDPDGHVIDINRMASHSLSLPVLACNVSTKKLDLQTPCCVCLKEGRLCFALLWKSHVILVKLPAISLTSLRFAWKSQLCNCPKRNPEK